MFSEGRLQWIWVSKHPFPFVLIISPVIRIFKLHLFKINKKGAGQGNDLCYFAAAVLRQNETQLLSLDCTVPYVGVSWGVFPFIVCQCGQQDYMPAVPFAVGRVLGCMISSHHSPRTVNNCHCSCWLGGSLTLQGVECWEVFCFIHMKYNYSIKVFEVDQECDRSVSPRSAAEIPMLVFISSKSI